MVNTALRVKETRVASGKRAVTFDAQKIDAIFEELDQCHLPGAAVGISIGGAPVYRKGFGLANMELPVVLGPNTHMRSGSVTKQFTCLAYMLLCEEGRARLDDPIGKHLPELHPIARGITARQLMTHTSGLRDVYEISLQFSGAGQRVSSEQLLSLYRDIDDTSARPETAWIYNNGAYLMLGTAIERLCGQPLEEVFRERLFEPIGMHDTRVRRFDDDFLPNSATPHATNGAGEFQKSYYGTDFAGAGAIVSTIDDLLRWLAHMDTPTVGSEHTWASMTAAQTLRNGQVTGYGLGLISSFYRGVPTISHPGGWSGGNAQVLKVPSAGLDVAIMVNRQDVLGMQLVGRILDVCIPDLEPLASSGGTISEGVFRSVKTGRVLQLFARDGQQFVAIDGCDWPFMTTSEGSLQPTPIWSYLKWKVTPLGAIEHPTAIDFEEFSTLHELHRAPPPNQADAARILGRFHSKAAAVEARILESDGKLQMQTVGRFGAARFALEPIAERIWRAKQLSSMATEAVLTLDDEGTLLFSSWNTRSLKLNRAA